MQLASAPLALPRFSAPACGRRGGLGLARPDRAAPAMAARLKGAGAGRDRHGNADLVLSPAESRDLLRPRRFALHAWHALERTKSGGGACQAMSTVGKSTNIVWHECPVGSVERQKLLRQKGCVIWVTGLSGSGKSTLACALSRILHYRGFLSYVLDGDNVRHGLNKDLSFKPEDRAENIRRIGEVAKLFADAGVICIASLISPYRRDRDGCRALLPAGSFIEVFMNMPLEICEARDSKGLYKLARAGKITGFTGIDDPYEAPQNCEIVIEQKDGRCPSPSAMAEQVVSYLEKNGYLQA